MIKICFILPEIKDNNFLNQSEWFDYLILNALIKNNYIVDVFCIKNNCENELKVNSIKIFEKYDFIKNALLIAANLKYDYTFATDYLPVDIAYIHKHSLEFQRKIVKTKLNNLFWLLFNRKKFEKEDLKSKKQKININKVKHIFTPSSIIKNDLINMLSVDGQKIILLPPYLTPNDDKNIKLNLQKEFTLGLFSDYLFSFEILLFLKAIQSLIGLNFKVKIMYKSNKYKKIFILLLKYLNLDKKIILINENNVKDDFLNTIDCYLSLKKVEPFGLDILKAMSKGKIVLISSRAGIKDIIENDTNGFIFDITQNPVKNLRKTLQYIIFNNDDFDTLRQNAIYTSTEYNIEKFCTELAQIINNNP